MNGNYYHSHRADADLAAYNNILLNQEMREYLRDPHTATLPYYDMVAGFMRRFSLKPDQAGRLLAQWIRESV